MQKTLEIHDIHEDFPRIITLLRKERGISQKNAAKNLDVSQALLSHYETGRRKCGFEFIIKAADYYKVSCDYLLGRSPEKTGATISVEDIPEIDGKNDKYITGSALTTLNKRLISNSINVLFNILNKCNDRNLTMEVSDYLMISVYKMFRMLYSANPKNNQELFTIHSSIYSAVATGKMLICEANAAAIANGNGPRGTGSADKTLLEFGDEIMTNEHKIFASSLLNLIKNTENKLK